jgi:hypothetical protein
MNLSTKSRPEPKTINFPITSRQPDSSNFVVSNPNFSYFNQQPRDRQADSQYLDCLAHLEFYLREPFNSGFKLLINKNYSLSSVQKNIVDFIERSGHPPNIELEDFEFFYIGKSVDPNLRICEFLDLQNRNPIINVVFSKRVISPEQKPLLEPRLIPKSQHGGLLTLPNYSALSKM